GWAPEVELTEPSTPTSSPSPSQAFSSSSGHLSTRKKVPDSSSRRLRFSNRNSAGGNIRRSSRFSARNFCFNSSETGSTLPPPSARLDPSRTLTVYKKIPRQSPGRRGKKPHVTRISIYCECCKKYAAKNVCLIDCNGNRWYDVDDAVSVEI